MNKQNKQYLKDKVASEIRKAKVDYAKDKPVGFTEEETKTKLRKSGFVVNDRYNLLSYVALPPSADHNKNKTAISKYNKKLDELQEEAIDTIELGDSKDALAVLASFREQLAAIK